MKNYSSDITNHRICHRLITYSRKLGGSFEYSVDQLGKTLDNAKIVDGYSVTFYRIPNDHYELLRLRANKEIKAKKLTEDNIQALKSKVL